LATEALRARILPKTDPNIGGSTLIRLLAEQHEKYLAVRALRRFGRPPEPGMPPLISTQSEQATLRVLTEAASASAYVDYVRMSDGVVRKVPLFANHRGYVLPQIGLALACEMLGADPREAMIRSDWITIPRKGEAPIQIPVHDEQTHRGRLGTFFDIPWFGPTTDNGWVYMYDSGKQELSSQHMNIVYLWEACATRRKIAKNNGLADLAIEVLVKAYVQDMQKEIVELGTLDNNDPRSRFSFIDRVLKEIDDAGFGELLDKSTEAEFSKDPEALATFRSYQAVKLIRRQNEGIAADLSSRRAALRRQLDGRAVLIGYIAVGLIADRVPTSLYASCPGVVAHGTIFNAIMTGNYWHAAPQWLTVSIMGLLGLLTTGISARLSAKIAAAATVGLAGGYVLLNGLVLFDKYNQLVGLVGPLLVVVVVWAGCTLAQYLLETKERTRIEQRFSARADPALVSYLLENESVRLDGQVKELTVVFTDLAGFTTLSERLKEETVPLLNRYMSHMIPIVRKHRGLLNKLLGDGIMFFFGAPRDNPQHAADAARCVLEMHAAMKTVNDELTEQGMPNLQLRAGICTGPMVVGDAGSEQFSDYTVIGDNANLGARLEGANKSFGTRVLVNDRCAELIGDRALCRPIGRIQVVGKTQPVMTYEVLSLTDEATDEQKKFAELTRGMVETYIAGRFAECLEAIAKLEKAFGGSRLTALYRGRCEQYLAESPESFAGEIVLGEK
jgi:class 3 adenylate cyclase